MASGVLFDEPGPTTRARHRLYTIVSALILVGIVAFAVWRLYDTGNLDYAEKWEVFVTPRYLEAILVDGVLKTLQMAFAAILLAVAFGVVFGIGKLSDHWFIRWPCWLVVEFFRAVPVVMLMIFAFFAIFGDFELDSRIFWSVVISLMLYNGAVLAEVFRAGILAVPKGQMEAAYAIGMRKSQVMTSILLPQGVKIMIPAIISQCVVALKDTSLGYVIGGLGLTRVAKLIYTGFGNQVATLIVITAIYVLMNLILTAIAIWVQRRFVGERKQLQVGLPGGGLAMEGQDHGGTAPGAGR